MKKLPKVDFTTKVLSNHNYLHEISVEGKRTSKFNLRISHYDQYVAQVIRTGNCITLLSNHFKIDVDTFWNPNYFEDMTRSVFWTFNKSFLIKLIDKITALSSRTLNRCTELLRENFSPYKLNKKENTDQEFIWCTVKNDRLIKSGKFTAMYELDESNRHAILKALENKADLLKQKSGAPIDKKEISFLDMLQPINGNAEKTLKNIRQQLENAEIPFDLFSPAKQLSNGKNPYGLNGCIAAMIDYFYQQGYFKKEYSLEEIFVSYLKYSGNKIGKLKSFISEFRQDNNYRKYSAQIRKLKIM